MTRAVVNDNRTIKVAELDHLPGSAAAEQPVEIELIAADVQPKDRQTAQGRVRVPLPPLFVHGSNAVGRRVDTGEIVFVRASIDAGGGLRDGVYAERFVAEERWLVPLPPGLDPKVAAAGTAVTTDALYALDDLAQLRPTETVLVLGSTTGVGAAAIDIALSRGNPVIAASRDPSGVQPRDGLKVVSNDELPMQQAADVVIDNVGGPLTALGVKSLAWRGRHVVLGYLAGYDTELKVTDFIVTEGRLMGMNSGSVPAERQHALIAQALQLLNDGVHAPPLARIQTLSEGVDALLGDAPAGRTILVP